MDLPAFITCFVPSCGCKADGVIPSGPEEVYPVCAKHAVMWKESLHRNRLLPALANFGRWGAEKILREWSVTEAVGVPVEDWQHYREPA